MAFRGLVEPLFCWFVHRVILLSAGVSCLAIIIADHLCFRCLSYEQSFDVVFMLVVVWCAVSCCSGLVIDLVQVRMSVKLLTSALLRRKNREGKRKKIEEQGCSGGKFVAATWKCGKWERISTSTCCSSRMATCDGRGAYCT